MARRSRYGGIVEWLLALAVIVAVPVVAWLSQERLIFFPQPLLDTGHLPAHALRLELVSPEDGARLAGFLLRGEGDRAPALVYFGGNAEEISWTLADRRWPRGWTIAGLNYRGYGTSEGKPGEQALVSDGLALFDAIARRPDVDPTRIVVFGRSIGTGVAVRVAAARPVAGVVLVSPFDSLVAIGRQHYPWLPVAWLLRHRFDSLSAARDIEAPLLAIAGSVDGIVPVARSKSLFDAWAGPKQWVVIEGAGHNDVGVAPAYWQAIANFLRARAAASETNDPRTGAQLPRR